MKKISCLFLLLFILQNVIDAQVPKEKKFGFGVNIGEPLGLTVKFWTNNQNAFAAYIGGSYFGNPRLGIDYLWHFNAFNSNLVKLYAGPGVHFGLNEGHTIIYQYKQDKFYYRASGVGLAVRGIVGINFIPQNTPLEFYLELGPLLGLAPNFGSIFEGAIGFRFYP
ncbi:hypothetical protein ABRY23_10540 [Melioribacteraceae bacterium 4301-Me]|uniref:hypothetical protein n=1 Tax=Pyranulibacter aquaticus TaxID=3163344 RepID=UPI003595A305